MTPGNHPCIGLALGGGGARSLAHIGVLKVLEQAGIPVHRLTGASMGGMIAAAYAFGLSLQRWSPWLYAWRTTPNHPSVDFAPFRRGFWLENVCANSLQIFLGRHPPLRTCIFPGADRYRFIPRAAGMLKEGSLVDAVLATCTVAGLWPPVQIGNTLLVDGGFYNNLPVDITRQMGADIVIALDAAPHFPRQENNLAKEPRHPLPGRCRLR